MDSSWRLGDPNRLEALSGLAGRGAACCAACKGARLAMSVLSVTCRWWRQRRFIHSLFGQLSVPAILNVLCRQFEQRRRRGERVYLYGACRRSRFHDTWGMPPAPVHGHVRGRCRGRPAMPYANCNCRTVKLDHQEAWMAMRSISLRSQHMAECRATRESTRSM